MGCPYSKAHRLPTVRWAEISRTAQTGDILLFGGSSVFGRLEEFFTATPYSHVAVFYRHPVSKQLYVAESSPKDGLKDFFTGRDLSGPRLVDARKKIAEYNTKYGWGVVVRRLRGRGVERLRADPMRMLALLEWIKSQTGKPFEVHKVEMLGGYTHRPLFHGSEDDCSWFCSEYVAALWMQMGIPMTGDRADVFCPQDFMEEEEDVFAAFFHGEDGGYLEREVLIIMKKKKN